MSEEIELRLKKKTWKELSLQKKLIFISSLCVMFLTLVYTGLNFENFNKRIDIITNQVTNCEMEFHNGYLNSISCPGPEHINILNSTGLLTKDYSLTEYYASIKQNPFYNLGGFNGSD